MRLTTQSGPATVPATVPSISAPSMIKGMHRDGMKNTQPGRQAKQWESSGKNRVLKKNYKSFLGRIQKAVNQLLESHKSETIDSMTRQRLATKLHSNTEGMQTMTSYEHAEIMCSMSSFYSVCGRLYRSKIRAKVLEGAPSREYTCAIEILNGELVSHGAIVSNVADVTQKERMEIAIIAKSVISAVPHSKEATTTDSDESIIRSKQFPKPTSISVARSVEVTLRNTALLYASHRIGHSIPGFSGSAHPLLTSQGLYVEYQRVRS